MAIDDQTPIGAGAVDFFQRALRYLRDRIDGLDDETLGWRPAPDTTAISNIVLHAVGSTGATFTVVVGRPEERDREAEFSAPPLPATALVERIDEVVRHLDSYRDRLTVGDLVARRPRPARSQDFTGLQVLLNSYGHLTGHIAQIELTMQLAERRAAPG